ncbi:MAG: alpha/beta fold hydrolase [Firmicutes bacterium]|nr:alpha/beta fold hydrolase [Bacillota bacterium]
METIRVVNGRGEALAVVYHPGSGRPSYIVVMCHGFRGSKEGGGRATELAERMSRLGYSVIRFDFAGAGESEGDFAAITLTRQIEDLGTILDWIETQNLGVPLVLGRSFGGSTVACRAALDERIKGICLWSTPTDLGETFSQALGDAYQDLAAGRTVVIRDDYGPFSLQPSFVSDLAKHDVLSAISLFQPRPVLIVHGEQDEVVPLKQAQAAFAAAGEPKQLVVIPGADHRFLKDYPRAWEVTLEWFQRFFPVNVDK